MKPISFNSLVLVFCILFIIFSSAISARLLEDKKALGAVKLNEITSGDSVFEELMGVEDCVDDGGEECLKRRMMAEVHLDYIYTQHHKP